RSRSAGELSRKGGLCRAKSEDGPARGAAWRRRTLRVVLQKSASAFDVPVPPRGYWAKLQNRALPTLVATLRSLPCSFAGSAAGRIWKLRSSPVFDREEGSPDRREA